MSSSLPPSSRRRRSAQRVGPRSKLTADVRAGRRVEDLGGPGGDRRLGPLADLVARAGPAHHRDQRARLVDQLAVAGRHMGRMPLVGSEMALTLGTFGLERGTP